MIHLIHAARNALQYKGNRNALRCSSFNIERLIMLGSTLGAPPPGHQAPRSWSELLNFPAGQAAILGLVVAFTALVTTVTSYIQNKTAHRRHTKEIAHVERQVQQAIVNNKLPADNVIAKKTDKPVE